MDVDEDSESSSSYESSLSGSEVEENFIEQRIKYGQEWLERRQGFEADIVDDEEWENLENITISFKPPVLEFFDTDSEYFWSSMGFSVGRMIEKFHNQGIDPSLEEITTLKELMNETNQMVKKWIANETRKLEIMKKKEVGIGA